MCGVNFVSSDSDDDYTAISDEKKKRRRVDDKMKEVVALDFLPKVDLSRVKIKKKTETVSFVCSHLIAYPILVANQVAYTHFCADDYRCRRYCNFNAYTTIRCSQYQRKAQEAKRYRTRTIEDCRCFGVVSSSSRVNAGVAAQDSKIRQATVCLKVRLTHCH